MNAKLDICKFAYQSIANSIDSQKEDLKSIRAHASIISAVNGLVVTFLSGFIFEVFKLRKFTTDDVDYTLFLGLNLETILALAFFGSSLVLSALVLLPTSGWNFDLQSERIIEAHSDNCYTDLVVFYKKMTSMRMKHFEKNEELLSQVQNQLFYAVFFSVFQIPFWLWNLF